jgi:hypothetical protein
MSSFFGFAPRVMDHFLSGFRRPPFAYQRAVCQSSIGWGGLFL